MFGTFRLMPKAMSLLPTILFGFSCVLWCNAILVNAELPDNHSESTSIAPFENASISNENTESSKEPHLRLCCPIGVSVENDEGCNHTHPMTRDDINRNVQSHKVDDTDDKYMFEYVVKPFEEGLCKGFYGGKDFQIDNVTMACICSFSRISESQINYLIDQFLRKEIYWKTIIPIRLKNIV